MKLPHPLVESPLFGFENSSELTNILAREVNDRELELIHSYAEKGLPPVTSAKCLAAMFGYNPGFVWLMIKRTEKFYRVFDVEKGKGFRRIEAPKVALKLVQSWLAHHFQSVWNPSDNAYGFISGKSHLQAAQQHLGARWVFSLDIENFFPSVSEDRVQEALAEIGYEDEETIAIIAALLTYRKRLTQGAPSSPVISNVVLRDVDKALSCLAAECGVRYTRYADDLVFSGTGEVPEKLEEISREVITSEGWKIAEHKVSIEKLPKRLKVHGLLVHGKKIRLTKGYRNKIRAYKHLFESGKIKQSDKHRVLGHLNYAKSVDEA